MNRIRKILAILAVNVLLLAAGVVAIELIFGSWLDARQLNPLNLLKDRSYRRDVSSLYETDKAIITYTRDRHGLRGAYGEPAAIRILTVGGSTTDQRNIRDGETWQDVLQQQFTQAGLKVPVANAGVDGQSSFGHIANFQWWFPDIAGLAPEFIVFYVGLNDYHLDAAGRFDRIVSEAGSQGVAGRIRDNSALWHLSKKLQGTYRAMVVSRIGHQRVRFGELKWTQQALQTDYGFMAPRNEAYAQRLRLLADLTRKAGAIAVFVTQPSRHYRMTQGSMEGEETAHPIDGRPINGLDFRGIMRQMDSAAQAVAAEKGALFVDLSARTDWVDADFYDFVHMTPQGARKVGLLLYTALKDQVPPQRK